jgi:S1-C subfamily serine protease
MQVNGLLFPRTGVNTISASHRGIGTSSLGFLGKKKLPTAKSEPLKAPLEVSRANLAVAAIYNGNKHIGTGFLYKPEGSPNTVVLTNAHVVKRLYGRTEKTLTIYLPDGTTKNVHAQQFEARIKSVSDSRRKTFSPEMDLAALEIQGTQPSLLKNLKFRDLKEEPLKKGEPIFILGRSNADQLLLSDAIKPGIIKKTRFTVFQGVPFFIFGRDALMVVTSTVSSPGDSGGPVVDQQGRLVGMVSKGSTNCSYLVHGKDIRRTLKDWKLD